MDRGEALRVARNLLASSDPAERRRLADSLVDASRTTIIQGARGLTGHWAPGVDGQLDAYHTAGGCVWRWVAYAATRPADAEHLLPEIREWYPTTP